MFTTKKDRQKWSLASAALHDAFTDFILSRQAMRCSNATMQFYKYTAGRFVKSLEEKGVTSPQEVQTRHVSEYLVALAS